MKLDMVYVFRTTVKYRHQLKAIALQLHSVKQIDKWNFDLTDCDKILRVEATTLDTEMICRLLKSLGFECAELL